MIVHGIDALSEKKLLKFNLSMMRSTYRKWVVRDHSDPSGRHVCANKVAFLSKYPGI